MEPEPSLFSLMFAREAVDIARMDRDAFGAAITTHRLALISRWYKHNAWRSDDFLRNALARFYIGLMSTQVGVLLSRDEEEAFISIGVDLGVMSTMFGITYPTDAPS